jgi:hypothetical protein
MTWYKAWTASVLAAIKLADHFTILIQSLYGLHDDVTESLVVKEKFFLRFGKILILVRQHFHVECMHLACWAVLVLTGWSFR